MRASAPTVDFARVRSSQESRTALPSWASGLDPRTVRDIFGSYPTGVVVVSAVVDEAPVWFVASSFMTLSLDPPLVSVAVRRESTTWPKLASKRRLGISIFSALQEDVCRQLASKVPADSIGFEWGITDAGAVLIDSASAWFDCSPESMAAAGDHDLAILRVEGADLNRMAAPLVFHHGKFRRLRPRQP